jgi:nucleotide-binding universal stress UspA family protein
MKKSILILTDLSENALHAAEVATHLAGKLHDDLALLNCDDTISAISYYPAVPVMINTSNEDRSAKLTIISQHLKHLQAINFPKHPKRPINTLIRQGDLWDNVKEILKEYPTEMIVMGSRSGSAIDHILFGSDTKRIIDHATVPVLIVPPKMPIRASIKIIFGTNFLKQDAKALLYLVQLRALLGAQLDIVHVRQYGEVKVEEHPLFRQFIEEVCAKNSPFITYKIVYGKEVVPRLNNYCKENHADILALSHAHHSVLFQLFKKDTVEKSLMVQHIPYLIIPELNSNAQADTDSLKWLSGIVF